MTSDDEFTRRFALALMRALDRAMAEAHHADRCPHRYKEPCTCWRSQAIEALNLLEDHDQDTE